VGETTPAAFLHAKSEGYVSVLSILTNAMAEMTVPLPPGNSAADDYTTIVITSRALVAGLSSMEAEACRFTADAADGARRHDLRRRRSGCWRIRRFVPPKPHRTSG